jgi:lysophospholipase L1-like esterase
MNFGNPSRIQQTGSITQVQLYMGSKPTELDELWFTVWRKNGGTYDFIASEDILPLISSGAGIKTITLVTPMAVQVGDFTGVNWIGNTTVPLFLTSVTAPHAPGLYYLLTDPGNTSYNWEGFELAASITGYTPIQVYMQAPHVVFIGDSYLTGYPTYFPPPDYLGNGGDITISLPYKVSTDLGLVWQNQGIGAETTAEILARFTAGVIDKKPFFVVINGGGNDVADGVLHATTMANIEDMFDLALAAGIIVFFMLIPPLGAMDNTDAAKCDALNTDIIALCATMGVTVIDPRPIVGEFRTGDTPGNLHDLQAIYDVGDETHLNDAGQIVLATEVVRVIETKISFAESSPSFPFTFPIQLI